MVEAAQDKITIMAGGGLTKEILKPVIEKTGIAEVHFGAAIRVDDSFTGDISCEKLTEVVNEYMKITR